MFCPTPDDIHLLLWMYWKKSRDAWRHDLSLNAGITNKIIRTAINWMDDRPNKTGCSQVAIQKYDGIDFVAYLGVCIDFVLERHEGTLDAEDQQSVMKSQHTHTLTAITKDKHFRNLLNKSDCKTFLPSQVYLLIERTKSILHECITLLSNFGYRKDKRAKCHAKEMSCGVERGIFEGGGGCRSWEVIF